ncbi:hypothetical protein BDW74DRAFT_174544 [Aspergillus multicolor]|uniref:uncharacterized protein n=1 Tax=Aspergillus multicolor TaxID=41759 RepID=UPI003CCD1D4A
MSEIHALAQTLQKDSIQSHLELDEVRRNILALTDTSRQNNEKRAAELTSLTTKLVALINERDRGKRQLKAIRSLYYTELKSRQSAIANVHGELDWLYGSRQTSFWKWLKLGNGIFWISGLAGSGKSTLMKYAADTKRTKRALQIWAGGTPLYIASFYFWNQGLPMQKSQIGLFQSLLYQILKAAPHLVDITCQIT